ncbi:MAG: hypothetical protein V4857_04310 [Pseudomonadota bacterium]
MFKAVFLTQKPVIMDKNLTNPEHLKSLATIFSPDPRSDNQALLDTFKNGAIGIAEHHANVESIRLTGSFPETIVTQFETAKNLYLYAWYVYRFHTVAEHHALTCLELGLRLRFPVLPSKYRNKQANWKPTLRPLLNYAVETNAIKNEGFRHWHDQVARRARHRYFDEKRLEMVERDLMRIELDYSQAVPNDQDRDWNYLPILLEALPGIRNTYAHGSSYLHNQVLGTLELVCEILNQLYEADGTSRPK